MPPPPDAVAATAELLRAMLRSQAAYRQRWVRHALRMRTDDISYAAVSQVVALHLWDQGIVADSDRELPRRLRDRIRHALRGEQLSYETLTWIIESFYFTAEDSHKIWDTYAGNDPDGAGSDGVGSTLRIPPVPMVSSQKHQTKALFSRYYINSDRMLAKIETSHAMVALEDGVDTFGYSPRDTVADVQVIAGGSFAGYRSSVPGFIGVELRLDRTLRIGQHASLQYFTAHRSTAEPCTQVRRAARSRINDVDMRVIFDTVTPVRAWWCAWDSYDGGNTVLRVPTDLTPIWELHRFFAYIEHTVVGFEWEW
ncbi:hypothetical protein ACFVAV_18690 [Nocardia sp. NPDC057663]|uniref:hypothetical protein n=1 Tax=Nocardia sp. NPDC057663 TaxID=3346201 RepID=UPI00366AAEFD